MIRYILVDDEPKTLERVQKKINTIAKDYNLKHIASYNNPITALAEIKEKEYDLLIVDFEMPNCNGVELAKSVATNKKIIFLTSTTNNEQMVINTLDITGYLSKPFDIDEFKTVIKNKVIGKINATNTSYKKGDSIILPIGVNKDIRFVQEQVYYIITYLNKGGELPAKNCVHFYGKNDQVLFKDVRKKIKELDKELTDYNFKKINKSTIINMSHFKERRNKTIELFDTEEEFEVAEEEKSGILAKLRMKLFN